MTAKGKDAQLKLAATNSKQSQKKDHRPALLRQAGLCYRRTARGYLSIIKVMLNEVCSEPLVAVTTNGYDVLLMWVVPVHPIRPATAPTARVASSSVVNSAEARVDVARRRRLRNACIARIGRNSNASPMGALRSRAMAEGSRTTAAVALGVCTTMVTGVMALPAGRDAGVNTAVAPGGKPVTENVTGLRKVSAAWGPAMKGNVAGAPGSTVCVAAPPVTLRPTSYTGSVTVAVALL